MDDIRKDDQPHEFTWQMIYPDQTAANLHGGLATLSPIKTDRAEPRLLVRVDALSGATFSTDVFHPEDYHGPAAFPRLRATVRDVEPRFLALLLPLPAEVKAPEISFESLPDKRLIRIAWPGHVDVFQRPAGNGTPSLRGLPRGQVGQRARWHPAAHGQRKVIAFIEPPQGAYPFSRRTGWRSGTRAGAPIGIRSCRSRAVTSLRAPKGSSPP
jgi:hypothetical protein